MEWMMLLFFPGAFDLIEILKTWFKGILLPLSSLSWRVKEEGSPIFCFWEDSFFLSEQSSHRSRGCRVDYASLQTSWFNSHPPQLWLSLSHNFQLDSLSRISMRIRFVESSVFVFPLLSLLSKKTFHSFCLLTIHSIKEILYRFLIRILPSLISKSCSVSCLKRVENT